jgi:ABC-type branched-subunit amino acid transport system ATPase component/branched-subunit amino acid ABC-type transport system permease component
VSDFLPFIVVGLATGAVYGLAGIGLVLTYKTSGIFNFGYGAVAALVAFAFYFLWEHGLPWGAAAAISVLVVSPIMGLLLELMARTLSGASETIKVVATVGLILIADSIGTLWFPTNPPTFPTFLPQSTRHILGVNVSWAQMILFIFSAVAAGALYWFFRSVRPGIIMRAVVDSPDLVAMSGDDPVLVRRRAWIIGSLFAGIAGLFLAPTQQLDGATLTTAVFAAFGAAAIGYFTNLPLTFAGGLVVGVAGALVDKYSATVSWVGGLSPALPFIILFIVLIVLPKRLLLQRILPVTQKARDTYVAPVRVRLGAYGIAIILLALVPVIQSGKVAVWSEALINIILFLSLGLLVRRSGQISLCHLAFAAVGAAAFGHFAGDGIPWLFSLIFAALVAVPVGAIVAIPAVRVSRVFLALATLGFGILMEQAFYTRNFMFGASPIGLPAPRPNVTIGGWNMSTDTGFFYVLLIITVLTVIVLTIINRGRLGRLLEAMADSPLALETYGTTSSVLKVIVFCITAAIAAMAGALEAQLFSFGIGTYFPSFESLILVALVVIVTVGDPWYAVIAAIGYSVIPAYITGNTTTSILNLLFGLGAATAALAVNRGTTPQPMRRFLDRLGGRAVAPAAAGLAGPAVAAPPAAAAPAAAASAAAASAAVASAAVAGAAAKDGPPAAARTGLEVRDLSVRFGGVHAVNSVSLKAPCATITGLIGPNGAGKTTTFNACSALVRPSSGRITLHDLDVTREGPPHRARRGLGRTFQRTELYNSLTVRQNVAMGREASMAGANPLRQIFSSRHSNKVIDAAVADALELTGTTRLADAQAGLLPIGQRRLVELARALAGPFDMLLLDEPSSGLDGHETERFGQVLRAVVRERGVGILLVEHDMTLVRDICDYVYVLEFGQLIFEGSTAEMQDSPQVRAAYLGDFDAAEVTVEDAPEGAPAGAPAPIVTRE